MISLDIVRAVTDEWKLLLKEFRNEVEFVDTKKGLKTVILKTCRVPDEQATPTIMKELVGNLFKEIRRKKSHIEKKRGKYVHAKIYKNFIPMGVNREGHHHLELIVISNLPLGTLDEETN